MQNWYCVRAFVSKPYKYSSRWCKFNPQKSYGTMKQHIKKILWKSWKKMIRIKRDENLLNFVCLCIINF